jgi:pimeloyl-ACP methyl ester carboxylesterase
MFTRSGGTGEPPEEGCKMTVRNEMTAFCERTVTEVAVGSEVWRYHRLGRGDPIVWLTGGLRRACLAFRFLDELSKHHRVVAPDYRPVRTIGDYDAAFDAMLAAEGIDSVALCGQSYGGLLAQAYVAHRPATVHTLILSSSGPADYSRLWLPVEHAAIGAARILPERAVKKMLGRGVRSLLLPNAEREEWLEAIDAILDDVSRADVISHFAVAADLIRTQRVCPQAFSTWNGAVMMLAAENDPTQKPADLAQMARLVGRPVQPVSLGGMGHAAVLFDPVGYTALLERVLAGGANGPTERAPDSSQRL